MYMRSERQLRPQNTDRETIRNTPQKKMERNDGKANRVRKREKDPGEGTAWQQLGYMTWYRACCEIDLLE